jgi:uncharacterized protein YacL
LELCTRADRMIIYILMEAVLSQAPSRAGRFFTAVIRILILTVLFAGAGMAIGLFLGILGTVLYGAIKHMQVDMAMAYRDVAIPLAVTSGLCAFVYNAMTTLRRAMRGTKA